MKELFYKLYKKDKENFYKIIRNNLESNKKTFIVTANPETFMTGVPDGVGIVKAGKKIGCNIKERITGIDIAYKLLEYGNDLDKTIYLFGAKEEVIVSMKKVLSNQYPNLKIVGTSNGYIVLVALGIPLQEKLIYEYLDKFKKGIFVGVGGSFDVISGHKKRAPEILIKLDLEWLYRIIKEPKRLKRFYNSNIKFIMNIRKYK